MMIILNVDHLIMIFDAFTTVSHFILKIGNEPDSVKLIFNILSHYNQFHLPMFAGSLIGDEWTHLIENLLPKHPDVYQKIHANLQLKVL